MKISIKNLGAIKQAEFILGELTIICGGNNTGKTYATYALFGFLSSWRNAFSIKVPDGDVRCLMNEGSVELDIQDYIGSAQSTLKKGCAVFTKQLPHVYASSHKHFSERYFSVDSDLTDIQPIPTFYRTMGAAKPQLLPITKNAEPPLVNITLLGRKKQS